MGKAHADVRQIRSPKGRPLRWLRLHESMRCALRCLPPCGAVGAGNDPVRVRCGCFLPDLTGLAKALPARLPRRIWGKHPQRARGSETQWGSRRSGRYPADGVSRMFLFDAQGWFRCP